MSEEQKQMNKWTALIICSVIIAGSYLYVQNRKLEYLKSQYKDAQEQRDLKILDRNKCLDNADKEYYDLWNANCKGRKLKNDCALPLILSDRIDKQHKEVKEECIKMYPVN